MNNDLKRLDDWLCANRLSLNTAKTKFIIFRSPRSNCENRITSSLNHTKLYESTKIRYLGLILVRLESSRKLSRAIGLLSKAKHFCSLSVLRSLYFSLFNSHLSYGISVWEGNVSEMLINKIKMLQNRCIWIIFSASLNIPIHCNEIRKTMRILNSEDQLKFQISSLM